MKIIKQQKNNKRKPPPFSRLTETARLLRNVRNVFSRRSNTRVNMEIELSREYNNDRLRHLNSLPSPNPTKTHIPSQTRSNISVELVKTLFVQFWLNLNHWNVAMDRFCSKFFLSRGQIDQLPSCSERAMLAFRWKCCKVLITYTHFCLDFNTLLECSALGVIDLNG